MMIAVLVRAARQVERAFEAAIDIHRHVQLHRPDEP